MKKIFILSCALLAMTYIGQASAEFDRCNVSKNLPEGQAWSKKEQALHKRKFDNCQMFNQQMGLADLYLNKPQEEASSPAAYSNLKLKFEATKAGCREPQGIEATDYLSQTSCTNLITDLGRALELYNQPAASPKGARKAASPPAATGGNTAKVSKLTGKPVPDWMKK